MDKIIDSSLRCSREKPSCTGPSFFPHHWLGLTHFRRYTGEGMDVMEFSEAENNTRDLMWVLGLPLLYPVFLIGFLSVVLNINRWALWGSKHSGHSYSPVTSTKKLLPRMTRRNNMRSKPRRKNNAPNVSLTVLIQKLVSRSAYSRQYISKPPIITVCPSSLVGFWTHTLLN